MQTNFLVDFYREDVLLEKIDLLLINNQLKNLNKVPLFEELFLFEIVIIVTCSLTKGKI